MAEQQTHPLTKEVPGHLLQFEEKIFGITLTQLLTDLGLTGVSLMLTAALPLVAHLIVSLLLVILVLILVHGKRGGYTMLYWLYLLVRFWLLPRYTVWRPRSAAVQRGEPRGVQEAWLPFDELDQGTMGIVTSRRNQETPAVTCWTVFQVESAQNVRFLAETEQVAIYERFKRFLDGLGFPIKCLSLVEQADPRADPALVAQRAALAQVKALPRLRQLQQASLRHQEAMLAHCTLVKHFLVVSASTAEVTRLRADGTTRSALSVLWNLFSPSRQPTVTPEQVKQELRVRISLVKKALQQLDTHALQLDDQELLRAMASFLLPGSAPPSFAVQLLAEEQRTSKARWQKRIEGVHSAFGYRSATPETQVETGRVNVADLLAPSEVTVGHEAIEVTVRGRSRYQRYLEVTGFASDLTCGWQQELTSLSLPLMVMTRSYPLDSRLMIKKLELHLTKLESQKLSDRKAQRLTKTDQAIEAVQVKRVMEALARKKLKVFAVQMVLGLHASSPERLEERTRYLLSHLRDLQLCVRPLSRRHDLAWQACLPTEQAALDHYTNLPSDVLSTFLNWSTGVVGTPSGAYLGTTGTGLAQRSVYFNPWDERKRLPNPHVVICGESGMGKSWLAKTLVTGLLCANIADAVVLDRDGDYDPLHEYLQDESQRFNLAGVSPINLLDIPYGPADVALDDPVDLMSEFIENHLLIGLALLYGEPLSKGQEAFLTHAAREVYAAKGITMEAIRRDPNTLLHEPPVFADLLSTMKEVPAASETVRQTLLERFEQVAYLFPGQTSVRFDRPLTIFNIRTLDEKWYPLLIYVVQTCLMRHRTLKRDERYLAYVVEEASYMLKHPAGRRYLESGSRGFRKLGIAQFTLSQHPADFLEEGQVIIGNAGTCFFLGMQRHTAQKLKLAEELERVLEEGVSGRAIMRCGREYAAIDVAKGSALHRAIFTTDPCERRALRLRQQVASTPVTPVAATPPQETPAEGKPEEEAEAVAQEHLHQEQPRHRRSRHKHRARQQVVAQKTAE